MGCFCAAGRKDAARSSRVASVAGGKVSGGAEVMTFWCGGVTLTAEDTGALAERAGCLLKSMRARRTRRPEWDTEAGLGKGAGQATDRGGNDEPAE